MRECDWGQSPNRLAWLARAARATSRIGCRSPRDLRHPGTGDKVGNPVADCSGELAATELATEEPFYEASPSLALVGPPGWPVSVDHASKAEAAQWFADPVWDVHVELPCPAPIATPPPNASMPRAHTAARATSGWGEGGWGESSSRRGGARRGEGRRLAPSGWGKGARDAGRVGAVRTARARIGGQG